MLELVEEEKLNGRRNKGEGKKEKDEGRRIRGKISITNYLVNKSV